MGSAIISTTVGLASQVVPLLFRKNNNDGTTII